MTTLKLFCFSALCAVIALAAPPARAQDGKEPAMPKPLQTLVSEGAQVRYLGNENGMQAWMAIQRGQEQYFYVTPKGDAMIMGLMFEAESGRMVTLDQVRRLQKEAGGVLDLFAEPAEPEISSVLGTVEPEAMKIKTPAEKLMEDVESSNYLALGDAAAPVVYAFIDPQCQYCHSFVQDLRANYLPNGALQLRMIPVGFREETKAQAAFMLAAPDAQARFLKHLDGDKTALPVNGEISQQGVERNLAIMQSWKLNVTPLIVYRAGNGEVKIIQGRAKDLPGLVADVAKKS